MKFNIKIAVVPLDSSMPLSYFTYKTVSIEAIGTIGDELFRILLLEIPELSRIIIDYVDDHYSETLDIDAFKVPVDFSNHEELLLYYKLSKPEEFDNLLETVA